MKNKLAHLVPVVLLSLNSLASDEMYFSIESLFMTKTTNLARLEGEARAKKVFVVMDDNEFDIELENDEVFTAKTYLEKDKFTFFKDGIKFSTPLNSTNPVLRINHLEVDEAQVQLTQDLIYIAGDRLKTHIDELEFYVDNLDMSCKTEEFTTDIERACVGNVKITPNNQAKLSSINVEDLSKEKSYKIGIHSREVMIEGDKLLIDSQNIEGFFKNTKFALGRGFLKCYKDPRLFDIDVIRFLDGCFYESSVVVDDFKFKQSAINLKVNKANINFQPANFRIKADYASFSQNGSHTYVSGMLLECLKDEISTKGNLTQSSLLNGCIKKATFKIDNIEGDKNLDIDDEEAANFKNLVVSIDKGNFKVKIKPKLIFRVPVEIEGTVKLSALVNEIEITVKDATVAGVPSKNYALKLIKKFVDNERIKLKGSVITIQI